MLFLGTLIYSTYIQIIAPTASLQEKKQYYFLYHLNIVLLSLLTLVMVRYIIKLVYERRRQVVGSKLKSRLVFAFLSLFIAPLLLFFYITTNYLSNKIGSWLAPQTTVTIDKAIDILQELKEKQRLASTQVISNLERNLRFVPDVKALLSFLDGYDITSPINGLAVYSDKRELLEHRVVNKLGEKTWQPLAVDASEFDILSKHEFEDAAGVLHTIAPIQTFFKEKYFLEVYFDPSSLNTNSTSKILDDLALVQTAIGTGKDLTLNYNLLLAWISCLMIFGFLWFAIYLSRTIVQPLEQLLFGMQKATAGDLSFRLSTDKGRSDELHQALLTFNEMLDELSRKTVELNKNQKKLSTVNADLYKQNQILEKMFRALKIGSINLNSQGTLSEANDAFLQLFKVDNLANLKLPANYEDVLPPSIANIITILLQSIDKQKNNYAQTDLKIFNGNSENHYRFEIYKIEDDKKLEICRLVLVHDVTELDKLMHSRAWQEVAQRIAHEIKNPLTPIRIAAERIKNRNFQLEDKLKKELTEMTNVIIDEVDDMKNMINEFSNFVRMPLVRPQKVAINSLLNDFVKIVNAQMPYNIKIESKISADSIYVMLDVTQFKQALQNLINNALNALEHNVNGVIVVSSVFKASENKVLINIEDNGVGIPQKLLGRIFEPYITTSQTGMGLGLAIVQKIIHDHDGLIKAHSIVDKKTIFTITLPVISEI